MEAQGLIKRVCDVDKRSHKVFPTEKGIALSSLIRRAFEDTESIAFCGFSQKEIAQYRAMQKRIFNNLRSISNK